MFDNPNEELKKLEDQLLAAEEPGAENFDAIYDDILKEFGPDETGKKQTQSAPHKKAPQGQKKSTNTGTKKGSKKRKKKHKGIKGLVITMCLEIAGILGILLWWIFRFL